MASVSKDDQHTAHDVLVAGDDTGTGIGPSTSMEIGTGTGTGAARSSNEPSKGEASPSDDASNAHGTGWVTLVKGGRKLVTSRVKLGPGARRQFVQQWARRKANDLADRNKG